MNKLDENMENNEISSEINSGIEVAEKMTNSTIEAEVKSEEKLETKGLKLKKNTKNRLNELQANFVDAESMVQALLNQYEMFKITTDNKFADRKAEIDKFTYLLDSIKSSYINSLEMATFIEEKYEANFKEELLRREKSIVRLQETIEKKEIKIKEKQEEVNKKEEELKTVKESFSRVNLALSTLEKENKDKADLIKNTQMHLASLTEIAEEGKIYKEEAAKLKESLTSVNEKIKDYELTKDRLDNCKKEAEVLKEDNTALKEELKESRDYANSLNNKLLDVITLKNQEINELKDENNNEIKVLEKKHREEINNKNSIIDQLKEEIYQLKMEKLK